MAMVGFVQIGEELFRRVVVRASRRRAMDLPEILKAGRLVNGLPVLRRAAFSLAVVHHGDARADRMHELRRARMWISVTRGVKHGECADQIIRTSERMLLIPGQIAKIDEPEAAVPDDDPNRFKIFWSCILIFQFGIAAQRIRRPRPRRSRHRLGNHVSCRRHDLHIETRDGNPVAGFRHNRVRLCAETEDEAIEQIARYLDRAGLTEGWLVLFDLRKEPAWVDKVFVRGVAHEGKSIHIVGC